MTLLEPPPAPACADRWPARIHTPEGTGFDGRAILTRGDTEQPRELVVLMLAGGDPAVVARGEWFPTRSLVPDDQPWQVATARGEWTVRQAGSGCRGCNAALSGAPWHPWVQVGMPSGVGSER